MKKTKCTLPIGAKLQSPKRVYTVEQVLGQGGFGITYKVSANIRVDNVVARTSFAVKEFFMKESCERDSHDSVCYSSPVKDKVEESKKDFLAEAQRLNKISLEHPNLIHVNEVFEANNTVYYVMEYLDGGSLRIYVQQHGPLSEHEALEMMKPIFKAVDFLHQNLMTHLDIKPDNIMLKRDADSGKITPVLIDFGLSKHYDKNGKPTSTLRVSGCSDGYAPMEQYVGIYSFTPQADVYALAATLFFTLTGKDPVIATELNKDKIVASLPESVCSKVKEAVVSAMKMRKEERTQSVRLFIENLCIEQTSNVENGRFRVEESDISTRKISLDDNQKKPFIRIAWIFAGALALFCIAMLFIMTMKGLNIIKAKESSDIIKPRTEKITTKKVSNYAYKDSNGTLEYYWTGELNSDNKPTGKGTATYPSNDKDGRKRYEGEMVKGLRSGKGILEYTNGNRYEGDFLMNEFANGKLTLKKEGMYYQGLFSHNNPYDGEWYYSSDNTKYSTVTEGKEK